MQSPSSCVMSRQEELVLAMSNRKVATIMMELWNIICIINRKCQCFYKPNAIITIL